MPTLIEKLSKAQALADAKTAIQDHYTSEVASVRLSEEQGMFSRTFIASLEDGSEVIVQLKDNEIDLTKVAIARALLGNIVPAMHAAKCQKAYFAYVSSLIPGAMWAAKEDSGLLSRDQNIQLTAQTGRLIAKCSLGFNHITHGIVEYNIIPRLHKVLEKEESLSAEARVRIEGLLARIDELKALPLALCHIDLNERNIIVDENTDIVGLIDWEQANLLPFGMNTWCIRYLAVKTVRGVDRVTEETLPMAQAFWQTLTADISPDLHSGVVTAMQVGFLLMSTFIEGFPPSALRISTFSDRHDWLESTFRPFCNV